MSENLQNKVKEELAAEKENASTVKEIPNKAYDLEYGTQFKKEVYFLTAHGIKYTFVKKNEYGVRTYKYTKTPELFKALMFFYDNEKNTREFNKWRKKFESGEGMPIKIVDENGKEVTNPELVVTVNA